VLRFLLWRLLGLLALLVGFALIAWCLDGGPGRSLRGQSEPLSPGGLFGASLAAARHAATAGWRAAAAPMTVAGALLIALSLILVATRSLARRRRHYVRARVEPHRTDTASAEAVVKMFERVQFLDRPGETQAQGATSELDGGEDADGRELVGAGELEVTF
jgi:hypothetical protein